MTDDEFEAACDDLMALIDADGSSACIADRTLSIDLHDWQVPRLIAALRRYLDEARIEKSWQQLRAGEVHEIDLSSAADRQNATSD